MSDETRRIQSVDRAFQILRQISENGCSSILEISEEVGLSPGTVHTHLATLKSKGFVQQEGKKYKLGMEFIPFSERARSQTDLFRAGKTEIEKLAHEYDAVAHLITEYQGKTLILYEMFGKDAIGKEVHTKKRDAPQVHTHCTAGGKAILAHLPESRVDQIIEQQGLPAYTSHTITDKNALYEELEQIRDQRYAVNNEEVVYGNQGIGAPIIDEHESVIGAISISGPANNWQGKQLEDELAKAVIRSANNIEINIHTETGFL
ncbi:IclR family transcriptional regulator [Halosolutus gelatinilyticus]|uniref:IclR family transcriptional regulator n=1 Tax=Halosolutus gelatinilyticus TaxID=2931975 RepID=UPI001FF67752|nr:IclR family transcriptional regulator [Halosolutus gelatinilyticus]